MWHNGGNVDLLHGFCLQRHHDVIIILPLIFQESLINTPSKLGNAITGMQIPFLIRGGNESELYQTTGHRRFTQYQESRLLDAFIQSAGLGTGILLHQLGYLYTLGHIVVLNEFKHDIALRGTRVKALVALLIVSLIENHLVLALSHGQVVGSTVHTQRIGLHASGYSALGQGIGMHGDKQVCLVAVCYVSPGVQRDKDIGLTGIDDLHVRTVVLHQPAEGQRHVQVDRLLLGQCSHGSRIIPAMSGINYQRKLLRLISCQSVIGPSVGSNRHYRQTHHKSYQRQYPFLHFGCKSTVFPLKISLLLLSFIIY